MSTTSSDVCWSLLQLRRRATGELQSTAIAARVYYWIKIYQSSPILNHLTSLTSICFGQGVWEEGWMTAPWRWQSSAWGSWPMFPCWASEEDGEQELYVMKPFHNSRLLSIEAWGATSTPQRYLFLGSTRYYTIFWVFIRYTILSHDICAIFRFGKKYA